MVMKGVYPMEARRMRIGKARQILRALGEVSYGRGLALLCINLGTSEAKAREYIRNLDDAGYVVVSNGKIKPTPIGEEEKKEKKKIDELIEETSK